jgi:ribosomal protein L11 methyltransferase
MGIGIHMKWTKFTLSTVSDAVDLISDMLTGLGIDGIEIVDNIPITEQEKKAMFIDILPEVDLDDNNAKISFYLEEEEDIEEALVNIQEGLSNLSEIIDIGSGLIEISETQDVDWINNWKAFFGTP